jgi:hypothetical protein
MRARSVAWSRPPGCAARNGGRRGGAGAEFVAWQNDPFSQNEFRGIYLPRNEMRRPTLIVPPLHCAAIPPRGPRASDCRH